MASRVIMFEMYATCPTTGQLTYAGVGSTTKDRKNAREVFVNAKCPACGEHHDTLAAGAWLEISLSFPQGATSANEARQAETVAAPSGLRTAA